VTAARAFVEDDFPHRGVRVHLAEDGGDGRLAAVAGFADVEMSRVDVDEAAVFVDPRPLRLTGDQARAMYEALARYFGGAPDMTVPRLRRRKGPGRSVHPAPDHHQGRNLMTVALAHAEPEPPLILDADEKAAQIARAATDAIYARARQIRRRTLEVAARREAQQLMADGDTDAAVGVLAEAAAKLRSIGDEPDRAPERPPGCGARTGFVPQVPDPIRQAREAGLL
jgi:hypothetical protein